MITKKLVTLPEIKEVAQRCCIPEDSAVVNDCYIVTKAGDVYKYYSKKKIIKRQKGRVHTNGYLRASLNRHDFYIHRLVAECYIPNPDGLKEVNHKDGNKKNNCVENLEWCTRSQNNKHAFQTGLRSYSELTEMAHCPRYSMRKFTEEDVRLMRKARESGTSDKSLAMIFGCTRGVIYQICSGKTYKEVA